MGGIVDHTERRRQRVVRAAHASGLGLLAAVALLGLVACGGSSGGGSSGGSGDQTAAGQGGSAAGTDGFLAAYPVAQEAVAAQASDAVLFAAGTSGLALADVPDNWSFTFFSPSKQHAYIVDVEGGTANARDFGAVAKGTKVLKTLDMGSVAVGAADAVVKAREFGAKSGSVPKNVMVVGTFAETPSSTSAGFDLGVWTVTFATGTDLADAQAYTVDMKTGQVAKAKK
jgi:hypothetical protein